MRSVPVMTYEPSLTEKQAVRKRIAVPAAMMSTSCVSADFPAH